MRDSIDRYFELLPILVLALAVLMVDEAKRSLLGLTPGFRVISAPLTTPR